MFPDHELAAIAAAAHEVGLSLSLPAGALIQPSLRRRDGCDGCARGGGVTPGPARPPPALEEYFKTPTIMDPCCLSNGGGDYTQAVSVVRASTYRTDKGLTKILADGKNWRPLAATRTSLWLWYNSTAIGNISVGQQQTPTGCPRT